MADSPSNPKKIKDLKARLGRTVAPGGSSPGSLQPPGAPPTSVRPPSMRPSSPGGYPAPTPSVPAPVAGVGPGAVAPPPFVGSTPAQAADPFAPSNLAPQRGPQEVRIVVDDAAIAEGAAGKKSTVKVALLLAAGLVLGLAVGYFVSSLAGERQQFNLALRDAKDIYSAVQGARSVMEQTQTAIDATLAAAKGQGGAAPRVDYAAIERLRALKKPFDAGQFARKRYLAFEGTTVDDLFAYYNNINLMWDKIERLAARTLSEQRRKALDASAATAEVVATPTGCVPTTVEGRTMCGLVFLAPKEGSEDAVLVRSSLRSSQTVEKKIFREGTSLGDAPSDYVFIVDPTKSAGVLGQGASEFAIYVGEISDLKALVVQTMEIQGRLEQGLGKVARLNEL